MKGEELKKDLVAGLIIAVISIVMMACNPENGHSETNALKENQQFASPIIIRKDNNIKNKEPLSD